MTATAEREHVKQLPLDQVDEPQLDARIDRDDDELAALGVDIKMNGLIEPIKVVRRGDRFEIVDGYRRYLAMVRTGLVFTAAFVYPTKELALEGVKYRANAFREDMSVADEAIYFNQLFTHECEYDITRVAALVNKTVNYVGDRINLVTGDAAVFDALRAKKISIGVAQILNRIDRDEYRAHYLTFAMKDGITRGTMERWFAEYKAAIGDVAHVHQAPSEPAAIVPVGVYDVHACYICGKSDARFIPEQIPVHSHCRHALLDPMLERARGEA